MTPQQTALVERITADRRSDGPARAPACFLGFHILDAGRNRQPLTPQITKHAHRRLTVAVGQFFPQMLFLWLEDQYGLGFLAGLNEAQFRRTAEPLLSLRRFPLTIGGEVFPVSVRLACTWFPGPLDASPRFLLDAAEHVLRDGAGDSGFEFVTITSQQEALAAVGRCVDLLSDWGLSQKGSRTDRRAHKRQALRSRCLVRYFRAGTTDMEELVAQTRDVSPGGLALHVPHELYSGEIVEVELRKPDGLLFVAGRVLQCRYLAVSATTSGLPPWTPGTNRSFPVIWRRPYRPTVGSRSSCASERPCTDDCHGGVGEERSLAQVTSPLADDEGC